MKNYSLLEESISKLSKRKDHLESELKLRINQIEDSEKNYKARIKSEKEKYEQAIEQNRKQALEMQLQIRDLSENIAKLEATNKVLSNNNNEKIFYPNQSLDVSNTPTATGGAGTLAYYAPWGDVVMFYGDFSANSSLYELGHVVSGEEFIDELTGTLTIEMYAGD